MIDGIALTLALLSFAGFFWTRLKIIHLSRRNRMLRKLIANQKIDNETLTKQLSVLSTLDSQITALHSQSEALSSKVTALQFGKR